MQNGWDASHIFFLAGILGSQERWVTGDGCLFGSPARRVCVSGRVRHFAVGTADIAWHREFYGFGQRNSLGLQPSKTKELVCEAMVDSLAVLDVLVAIESYRPDNLVLSWLEELDKWASLGVNGHFTGPGSQQSQRKLLSYVRSKGQWGSSRNHSKCIFPQLCLDS